MKSEKAKIWRSRRSIVRQPRPSSFCNLQSTICNSPPQPASSAGASWTAGASAARRPAGSSVPGTIIGLGEAASMISFNSLLSIVSFSISRSARAVNALRRVSNTCRTRSNAAATMRRISSSISRAVCSLCVRPPEKFVRLGKEHRPAALPVRHPAQTAHAVVHDHAAGDLRGALEVVLGPGGDVAVDDFLGHRAGQEDLDAALQFALRQQVAVAFGPLHRVAQRGQPAGNDRNLVHRVGVRQAGGDQRMALSW